MGFNKFLEGFIIQMVNFWRLIFPSLVWRNCWLGCWTEIRNRRTIIILKVKLLKYKYNFLFQISVIWSNHPEIQQIHFLLNKKVRLEYFIPSPISLFRMSFIDFWKMNKLFTYIFIHLFLLLSIKHKAYCTTNKAQRYPSICE